MSKSGGRRENAFIPGFTIIGLFRWIYLRATHRQVIVEGRCLQCGVCCRELNLSRKSYWIRRKSDFEKLRAEYPGYERFRHIGYSMTGLMKFDCEYLTKEGYCSDHENRPDLCRSYPEPDLYFMGGEIQPYCGYSFKIVPSFGRMLDQEMKSAADKPPETPEEE